LAGGNFQIDGSAFLQTITGSGGITVGSIAGGGFSIDGSNLQSTSVVGISGATVLGTGNSLSVSGAGQVLVQQSLVNAIGSAFTGTLGTNTPIMKFPMSIPTGVNRVSIKLNAYLLSAGVGDFRIQIDNTTPVDVDILGVTSLGVDNITLPVNSPSILSKSGTTVMVKVFCTNSPGAEAVYLQGITITILD
jgi:hypothetical protein